MWSRNVVCKKDKRLLMARPGIASRGQNISLLTNQFKATVSKTTDGFFFHYNVEFAYEDGTPVNDEGVGRGIMDRVHHTHGVELDLRMFAYDGEKSIYTIGPLTQNSFAFSVIMEEVSWSRVSAGVQSPEVMAMTIRSLRKKYEHRPAPNPIKCRRKAMIKGRKVLK